MTQSIVTSTEAPLETKCGWKGVLKSIQSEVRHLHWASPSKPEPAPSSKDDHTVRSLESSSCSEASNPVDETWMGGEPSLQDETVERRGVMHILSALTESERAQVEGFDRTMPIRHFRAEKVRCK